MNFGFPNQFDQNQNQNQQFNPNQQFDPNQQFVQPNFGFQPQQQQQQQFVQQLPTQLTQDQQHMLQAMIKLQKDYFAIQQQQQQQLLLQQQQQLLQQQQPQQVYVQPIIQNTIQTSTLNEPSIPNYPRKSCADYTNDGKPTFHSFSRSLRKHE
jgi:hypothetical protein